jgi:thioredoxin 2
MAASIVTCPECGRRNRVAAARSGIPRCAVCGTALPWIAEASDEDFADVAERASVPVLLDLWAAWCAPCLQVAPMVERAAAAFAGSLKVVKVDVDSSPTVAGRFGVRGIPTLIVLVDGREVDRIVGVPPEEQLRARIEGVIDVRTADAR